MSAARSRTYDLAFLESMEEAVRSVAEVRAAARELVAAKQVGIPTRLGLARVRVDAAASRDAAAWSSLKAAVALEVDARE